MRTNLGACCVFVSAVVACALGCQKPNAAATASPVAEVAPGAYPLESQRDAIARGYRLAPDKRFLIAFSVVGSVLKREARAETSAVFSGDAWHLTQGGAEVGTLSELPGYTEASALLVAWSEKLLKTHPLTGPAIIAAPEPLAVTDSLNLLEATQRSWNAGEHSLAALQKAAHALVSLSLQTFDDMEMADEIHGRALGLGALVKAAQADTSADDALLAKDVDYWAAGQAIAAKLPPGAARAFVLHDDDQLEALARQPVATEATRGLFLRRLSVRQEHAREESWIRDRLPAAAYSP